MYCWGFGLFCFLIEASAGTNGAAMSSAYGTVKAGGDEPGRQSKTGRALVWSPPLPTLYPQPTQAYSCTFSLNKEKTFVKCFHHCLKLSRQYGGPKTAGGYFDLKLVPEYDSSGTQSVVE